MEDVNLTGLGEVAVPEPEAEVGTQDLAGPLLRTRTLLEIEALVMPLELTDPPDEALHRLHAADFIAQWAAELRRGFRQSLAAWLETNGDLQAGPDVRYYAGVSKVWACSAVIETLDRVLAACGGDLERVCDHLRSDPWRPASVRTLLAEDEFLRLFRLRNEREVREGKPKQVIRIDTRFVRSRP